MIHAIYPVLAGCFHCNIPRSVFGFKVERALQKVAEVSEAANAKLKSHCGTGAPASTTAEISTESPTSETGAGAKIRSATTSGISSSLLDRVCVSYITLYYTMLFSCKPFVNLIIRSFVDCFSCLK